MKKTARFFITVKMQGHWVEESEVVDGLDAREEAKQRAYAHAASFGGPPDITVTVREM